MSRLSKNQRHQLSEALRHAERALAYIMQPTVEVCRHSTGTSTCEYTRAEEPRHLVPMCKDIGSDLCGLEFAIRGLKAFLKDADGPSQAQIDRQDRAQERANDRHTYRQETGYRE